MVWKVASGFFNNPRSATTISSALLNIKEEDEAAEEKAEDDAAKEKAEDEAAKEKAEDAEDGGNEDDVIDVNDEEDDDEDGAIDAGIDDENEAVTAKPLGRSSCVMLMSFCQSTLTK